MKTLLDNVLAFATEAHKGQTRWKKNIPYITHPIAVADLAVEFAKGDYINFYFEDVDFVIIRIVSLWHDIFEDVDQYKDREDLILGLLEKFDENKVLSAENKLNIESSLKILNKRYHNSYLDFVLAASYNIYAKPVKMADITHNLSDLTKGSMKDKYELALYILKS